MNWGSRTWKTKKKLTLILPQSHKEERTVARLKKYLKKQWLEVFQISEKTEPYQSNTTVENPKKYTPRQTTLILLKMRKKTHQSIRNTGEQKFKRQSISHQKPKKPEGSGIVFSGTKRKALSIKNSITSENILQQWGQRQLTWKEAMVISCQQTYSKRRAGGSYSYRKETLTKGSSEQQEWRKGNRKGKHSKLFYSLVSRFIFDRSKKYSILSIQRGTIKDDFTVKGTG